MHVRAGRHRLFALARTVPGARELLVNMPGHFVGQSKAHAVPFGDAAIADSSGAIGLHRTVSRGLSGF